ncbi:phosphatidylinositol-specific phospholipase C/glycerophosphodiester phosphodiesterase family protein [Crateriforma conspicua]|uniref:Altered inheritance of mitochondria protein 6 n=1 Tax=Crateriforma conspicua TaxID=2527996 RepID=A0A5C5Y6T2_9PLAN|nr:phosphatidylinositol-specific phospholipase C/glycerophosphodiester phosphodiesterase family protein [Crateriforma conspicua]QDV65223.1 hypothetical protein Mal65_43930 [Crateriforma conspicua]TWT70618.1 hypothetical protein Pan14r_29250 [Crateriforma conspicua]
MKTRLILSWCVALIGTSPNAESQSPDRVYPAAHSHNDYTRPQPLTDALANGFRSVEADIFLRDGDLVVAHEADQIRPERTLRSMYLDPLSRRVRKFQGSVYQQPIEFILLVDIKDDGETTYAALHELLSEYASMLTHVKDGKQVSGAISVVISGNRPIEMMSEQSTRYAGIDGRLSDLDSDMPAHLMPMISDRWTSHFAYRGAGPIADADKLKLRQIVAKAHRAGRVLRFWATPEDQNLWQVLVDLDVDLINTDHLARLRAFLASQESAPSFE